MLVSNAALWLMRTNEGYNDGDDESEDALRAQALVEPYREVWQQLLLQQCVQLNIGNLQPEQAIYIGGNFDVELGSFEYDMHVKVDDKIIESTTHPLGFQFRHQWTDVLIDHEKAALAISATSHASREQIFDLIVQKAADERFDLIQERTDLNLDARMEQTYILWQLRAEMGEVLLGEDGDIPEETLPLPYKGDTPLWLPPLTHETNLSNTLAFNAVYKRVAKLLKRDGEVPPTWINSMQKNPVEIIYNLEGGRINIMLTWSHSVGQRHKHRIQKDAVYCVTMPTLFCALESMQSGFSKMDRQHFAAWTAHILLDKIKRPHAHQDVSTKITEEQICELYYLLSGKKGFTD